MGGTPATAMAMAAAMSAAMIAVTVGCVHRASLVGRVVDHEMHYSCRPERRETQEGSSHMFGDSGIGSTKIVRTQMRPYNCRTT